jgi:hypothetical protein
MLKWMLNTDSPSGAQKYEHYHVKEYADGRIELEPRVLVNPFEVSKRTLSAMDQSMKSLEKGSVSDPLDLSEFAE